jgi:hypothetical protein
MDGAQLYGRGMSFPPRVGPDGGIVWSEGEQNVQESIRVILQTEQQERLRLPDFGCGLGRFLFEPNTVMTRRLIRDAIMEALQAWEARINLEDVSVDEDPQDPQAAIATIRYRLVATGELQRVSVTVALAS